MVMSQYTKQRILSLAWKGYKVSAIVECLVLEDGIRTTKQGVRQFLKRYAKYKTIARNLAQECLQSFHLQFNNS